ncbi:hypothetical protein [Gangjinia marincola]
MRIKNYYFTLLAGALLTSTISTAQVGINTSDPQAQLDVVASNQASPADTDGLLVPRIDAFPATNPGADQNSMVVYLTTTVGADAPGFYFWDNATTDWVALGSGGGGSTGDAWLLTGNAGTTPGTNFLGTTDNQNLAFRTNNTSRLLLTTRGQLVPQNVGGSLYIGENSGANEDPTTPRLNTFIGTNTGRSITDGSENVAVGRGAMRRASTSSENNVAIGPEALSNGSGTGNEHLNDIAIGDGAMFNVGTSVNNVAIGNGALQSFGAARQRNIAIGNVTGANFSSPNAKLYIDNPQNLTLFPLIGGDFDDRRVGINRDVNDLVATLTVEGDVFAENGFSTPTNTYPDYVFEEYFTKSSTINPTYRFTSLEDAEAFVKENGHLPGVKSYNEIEANDMTIDLGEVSITNLEKIEELFIYITELNADNKAKEAKIKELEARLARIEQLIEKK